MKIAVHNETEFNFNRRGIEEIIEWLNKEHPAESSEFSIAFVVDETMEQLHEKYYGEEGTTDILTFDYDDDTLEIVLNPYQNRRQAPEANNSFNEEIIVNLVHGYLHGLGYDHTVDDGEHLRVQGHLVERLNQKELTLVNNGGNNES